ncbi:MAG TPA: hypothetical protein VL335_00500, partial [Candidatus Paceibacterota bacterium]|jgi:hypothetical protein|nr:hypothetical protein [Candidatus Paceibacterota bacterium]
MSYIKMERSGWVRRRIEALRNNSLRGKATRLYRNVHTRMNNPNVSPLKISGLERKIVNAAENLVFQYKCMIPKDDIVTDMVPDEHKNIRELLDHMIEQALFNVYRDEQLQVRMVQVQRDYISAVASSTIRPR